MPEIEVPQTEIDVTPEEIDYERAQWARDGIPVSDEAIIEFIRERKEADLWTGIKEGD